MQHFIDGGFCFYFVLLPDIYFGNYLSQLKQKAAC